MADLNALIAQGYQFQPLPDPFAQYGKMQQLENSAMQNRLAQQQMQENAQMAPFRMQQMQESAQLAPLRMQEAQARLNTSNLAYDQAKEAKEYVAKVMSVAAEHGGPTDPFEAAKQMVSHPNPQIQLAGKHLLDSYQVIQGIEQQQRYEKRAPSPTGFAAPTTAPTAAYMPTSAQGTLGGPTPAMAGALGSGTFDVNAPAPVANAFARAVPSVNALRPGAVTAESVAAEIKQGNKEFGNAPGWVKDREILMKQYEALLNPRQRIYAPIDASKYTPESIRAFNVSGDQSDLVAKEKSDKAVANINAADYTPTSVQAFSVSGDYADLVPKEKPIAKSDFDKLLDESGLSDPEKQAMRIAKLQKETAKPEQKAEARSEFEKLLDNSDLTEDQKAEARRAKITKETASSADKPEARSEFEKLLDASDMTEAQKTAARRARIAKETKISPTGGDGGEKFPTGSVTVIDPTDPAGKRAIVVTAKRAITEGLTPFTSIPKEGGTTEGERKAATLLQRLQFSESQLLTALGEDPNAAKPGLLASAVAKVSDPVANLLTPAARQRVEAAQLDILDAALTLGTGAAYTNEQLKGYAKSYFPQIGDKPENIKEKQARLTNIIQAAKIAAGRAEKSVSPAPNVGGSAINAADAILNKGRR